MFQITKRNMKLRDSQRENKMTLALMYLFFIQNIQILKESIGDRQTSNKERGKDSDMRFLSNIKYS